MSRDQARVALAARWAAVLLIFVMSMDYVHARTPKSIMMGQDLLHLVDSSSLGRQLRFDSGMSCPADTGYRPILREVTADPPNPAVKFSELNSLGWSVTSRPALADSKNASTYTSLPDFYSVMCNTFGNVGDNGKTCLENNKVTLDTVRGITHMRYDCTSRSVWILTYVLPGTDLVPTTGDMWVDTDCAAAGSSVCPNSAGAKTFDYEGGATSASCSTSSTCNMNVGLRTGICCLDFWPVTDTVTRAGVPQEEWIGYIAKGYFTLPGTNTAAWDTVSVHWDFGTITAKNTGSSTPRPGTGGSGICLNCAGSSPPPTPTCNSPTATADTVSYCPAASKVEFNITAAAGIPSATLTYVLQPPTVTGQDMAPVCSGADLGGGIYKVSCSPPASVTLPANGFSVSVTVNKAATASCAASSTVQSVTVTVKTPQACGEEGGPAPNPTACTAPTVTVGAVSYCNKSTSVKFNFTAAKGEATASLTYALQVTGPAIGTAPVCTPTEPSPAGSGGVYQVECASGNPPAALPAEGFSASLTVNQAAPASCEGAKAASKSVAVTVRQPPAYTVVSSPGTSAGVSVCSEQGAFGVNFTVAGDAAGLPLMVEVTPPYCKIGTENIVLATLSAAQTFEVTCTKPPTGWPADFTAVGGAFTAGTADCEAPNTTSIPVSIATKPVVSITGPTEPKQVCSNASDVTVSYTVSSGTAGTPLTVTAVAKSAANVPLDTVECTLPAAQQAPVTNGTIVDITCTPKAVGQAAAAWPEEGFYVVVTAESLSAAGAGLTGCSDTQTTSRQVTVIKKPQVAITVREGTADPAKVCSNETQVSLGYTVSSGASGADVTVTTAVARDAANVAITDVVCSGFNPAVPVTNGSNVDITCTLASGATWPEAGFYVDVTASAATSLTGCSDTQITSRQVQVIKKPQVSLTHATEPKQICSNETQVVLSYTLSSGASGVDVTLDTAMARTSANEALTGIVCVGPQPPAAVTNGTNVDITCTLAAGTAWPEAGFYVDVTASAATSLTGCSDTQTTSRQVTVIKKPVVALTLSDGAAESTKQVCNNETQVSLGYTVSSGASGMDVSTTTAVARTSANVPVTSVECMVPTAAVSNGTIATVTCSPKAVGLTPAVWPEGEFYVDVTASATTGLTGCSDTVIFSRKVNVTKKPNLAITAPPSAAVCSDNKALLLTYTVADQANSRQTINLSPSQSCQATGPNAAGQVNLTCADSTWAADFNVTLTASAGTTSCEDNKAATEVQVKYNTKPALSLTGDANKTVCANSGQVTLSFTPTATANGANVPWKMAFDTGSSGVTCPKTSGTGGTGSVNCSAPAGSVLPAQFTVNATLTSGATGCTTSTSTQTTVNAMCCIGSPQSSYAMGQVTGSSLSNATCFSTSLPDCGNSNWGWSNKLSGPSPAAGPLPTYPIIAGGGKDCKGRTTVGQVSIRCDSTGASTSTVTFGTLIQDVVGAAPSNHIYIGCAQNNACTPPSYFTSTTRTKISACGGATAVGQCGGNLLANIASAPITTNLNCKCDSVYWVFHQSGSSFTTARNATGGCSA